MSFLRESDGAATLARLESPRQNYATPPPSARPIRASRERQLPTNHGHAALPLGVIRAYQSDSSSQPPRRSAPSSPQESRARSRITTALTPVLPYQFCPAVVFGGTSSLCSARVSPHPAWRGRLRSWTKWAAWPTTKSTSQRPRPRRSISRAFDANCLSALAAPLLGGGGVPRSEMMGILWLTTRKKSGSSTPASRGEMWG